MQKDLIKDLCLTQGLIDIAGTGTASQSSVSHLSKENDAQRAINGTVATDYSFHTGKERSPWWQVEFESSINPHYIIINNRKHEKWFENSAPIELTCTDEQDNETIIHKGLLYFGALPNSLPLILPLAGKVKVKKFIVKINQGKDSYLHLSDIKFLVKDPLKSAGIKKVFIANRTDGLGERLRALLNAMILAKKMESSFLFSWSTMTENLWSTMNQKDAMFHATSEKNLIFNNDFQEKYLLDITEINKMKLLPLNNIPWTTANELKNYNGISVQQNNIARELPYPYADFDSGSYQEAFNEIGFSEDLLAAKKHAESISVSPKTIAIHIRAGDLVFGSFRDEPIWYGKVVPLYLLDYIIERLISDSFEIIVFGQDDGLCKYLAYKYNILYSKDLLEKSYNMSQTAIFDIVLMSKCNYIIAGASGFATLATWLGGSKIVSGYSYLPDKKNIIDEFRRLYADTESLLYASGIDPLIKSFTIAQFVYRFQDSISLTEKIGFIEDCMRLDPENSYHKVFLAFLYYKNDEIRKADLILIDEIQGSGLVNLIKLASMKRWKSHTQLFTLIDGFKQAVSKGSVIASILLLLNDFYFMKNVNAAFYEDIINSSKNELETALLERCLRGIET